MKKLLFGILVLCAGSYLLVQSETAQSWINEAMPGNKITETAQDVVSVIDTHVEQIRQELTNELSQQYAQQHQQELNLLNTEIQSIKEKLELLESEVKTNNETLYTTLETNNDEKQSHPERLTQSQEEVLNTEVSNNELIESASTQALPILMENNRNDAKKDMHLRQLRLQDIANKMQNISLQKGQ